MAQTQTRLDRALRVVADVRPGESLTALLLALNVFTILTAYYILKPVREALILGQGSPELKSYMSVGQVALLMIVVPLYARLVNAFPRLRLIRVVTWFFVACLVGFYVLARVGVPLGIIYFLWIGIFNLMIVAQFWGFANDLYTKDEGERLFPIVGFGASLGAVLGSVIAGWLIAPLGVYQMMLVGAVGLVLQLQITAHIDRRERGREANRSAKEPGAAHEEPAASGHSAFALVFGNRYLLFIGIMLMLFYCVDATGEYILGSIVTDRATETVQSGRAGGLAVEQLIGQFYSRYFGLINITSLLLQLFLVSRIVKYLGVGRAIAIQPALSVLAYTVIGFLPVLGFVLASKVSEKATDYSLNNTVRNMLFLPCTREEKYSAKQVIDSLFVRLGDVSSAALVFIGTTIAGLGATGFARVNIMIALAGLATAALVGRGYQGLTTGGERQKRVPQAQPVKATAG
ncbi:MAG: translocase [Acidobacteria bacterium]|nr:MAG: translocase [Acidobacteriota bacterium]